MSEKIAMGVGVPFSDPLLAASSSGVGDGYYYQLDLADPRTATGWTAGSLLHDGSTSTGHVTAAGGSTRYVSLLVAKAAGMTLDNFLLAPGYTNSLIYPTFYGSDDLVSWTVITMNAIPAPLFHSSFSYEPGVGFSRAATVTYKYVAFALGDSAGAAQAGCGDIRVRSGVAEVGP